MRSLLFPLALLCSAPAAWAQSPPAPAPVAVEAAWARASVPGQKGTGAFMQLTAREPLTLVGVSSPAAGVAEVHEMKMEGDVMKMRAIPALELPVGKPVALKPGGHHLMLLDLKAPLKADTRVPVTLSFRNAKGEASSLTLEVPVQTLPPPGTAGKMHKH
jgi:copper(I)-binding protein